jgi:hypothetical protein
MEVKHIEIHYKIGSSRPPRLSYGDMHVVKNPNYGVHVLPS